MLINSNKHVIKNILFWRQQVNADMQKKGPFSHNVHDDELSAAITRISLPPCRLQLKEVVSLAVLCCLIKFT